MNTPPEPMKVWRCPVHGGQLTEGQRCRVVTKRSGNRITHCHEAEEVEVIPVDSVREFVTAIDFEVGCMEHYGETTLGTLGKLAREMAEPIRKVLEDWASKEQG